MIDDLEIDGGPLDDDDIAQLAAAGAEIHRKGESFLCQLHYQNEICRLTEKRAQFIVAVARAEKANPDDSRIIRATAIIAELDARLGELRRAFLRAWRPDNGPY